MKRYTGAAVLAILLSIPAFALGYWSGAGRDDRPSEPDTVPVVAVAEDDPTWDCHNMGNHLCGPLSAVADDAGWWVVDGDGITVGYISEDRIMGGA